MRQMFALTTPDDLIRTLADTAPADIVPHFFSFGGIPATARWASAVADGRIALDAAGGFRVEPPKG
jgi:methylenetetrahydrofolate reductase (NADPH)